MKTTTRLTKNTKYAIRENVFKLFREEVERLVVALRKLKLGTQAYKNSISPELSEAIRVLKTHRSDWIREVSSFDVFIIIGEGEYIVYRENCDELLPTALNKHIPDIEISADGLGPSARELAERLHEIEVERNQIGSEVDRLLDSVTNANQLCEVWPGVQTHFLPKNVRPTMSRPVWRNPKPEPFSDKTAQTLIKYLLFN